MLKNSIAQRREMLYDERYKPWGSRLRRESGVANQHRGLVAWFALKN
jgi:hypothetical protein